MKHLLPGIILLSIVAVLWSMFSPQDDPLLDTTEAPAEGTDAYMKAFTLHAMDTDGRPAVILEATSLKILRSSDTAILEAPRITLQRNGVQRWLISAGTGTLDEERNHVTLSNDVDIARLDDVAQPPLNIRTDALAIDIDAQLVTTRDQVNMTRQGSVLTSQGMRLDHRNDRLELLASVEGYHALD